LLKKELIFSDETLSLNAKNGYENGQIVRFIFLKSRVIGLIILKVVPISMQKVSTMIARIPLKNGLPSRITSVSSRSFL
jgi:hypothetical protein